MCASIIKPEQNDELSNEKICKKIQISALVFPAIAAAKIHVSALHIFCALSGFISDFFHNRTCATGRNTYFPINPDLDRQFQE